MIIFGKGELAVWALDYFLKKGVLIEFVVPVDPEPTWSISLKNYSRERKINVLTFDEFDSLIKAGRNFKMGLSIYFDKIFSKTHIERVDTFLNLHNSPLPKYRGMNPINWALENEEKLHGVTIHKITTRIDDGDIYGQKIFSICPDLDEVEDVYKRCLDNAKFLIENVFENFSLINPIPQNHDDATYYSKSDFSKLVSRKDWNR